jgi:uncharacterized protein (TIGR02996 family)
MTPADAREHLNNPTPHALAQLLAFWRTCRSPSAANVLEKVSSDIVSREQKSSIKDVHQFQAWWIKTCSSTEPDDVTLAILISTLIHKLPKLPIDGELSFLRTRLRSLANHGPDPRVAQVLVTALLSEKFNRTSHDIANLFWSPDIFTCDARQAQRLKQEMEHPHSKTDYVRRSQKEAFPTLIEQCLKNNSLLSIEDERLFSALIPEFEKPQKSRSLNELKAAVFAAPINDAAKAVYSDALMEHADPRGEFISLQNAPNLDDAGKKKMAALQNKHAREWLGALFYVTKKLQFEKGFLHSIELERNAAADAETWALASQHEELSTVSILKKGHGNADHFWSFIASPRVQHLNEVDVPTGKILSNILGASRPTLETLNFIFRPGEKTLHELSASKNAPNLKTISFLDNMQSEKSVLQVASTSLPNKIVHVEFALNGTDNAPLVAHKALEKLLGNGAIERVSFSSHNAFVSIVKLGPARIKIEGHDEWAWLVAQVLPALELFSHVEGTLFLKRVAAPKPNEERGFTAMHNQYVDTVTGWNQGILGYRLGSGERDSTRVPETKYKSLPREPDASRYPNQGMVEIEFQDKIVAQAFRQRVLKLLRD